MKTLLCTILILLGLTSCSTYSTLIIEGEPGTIITDANEKFLGEITHNNTVEIKIDNDNYYPYLLSKSPNSNIFVPFATEFKEEYARYYLKQGSRFVATGLSLSGLMTTIIGGAMQDEDVLLTGGLMALGAVLIMTPEMFVNDGAEYCYRYLQYQNTNNDIIGE